MASVTPYSNWELLNPNDNPNDRYNCVFATVAGLLGLKLIKELKNEPNLSQFTIG